MTAGLRTALQRDFESFLLKAHGERLDDCYISYLAHELAKVARREIKRLIVNLPPRHLKTFASSICLPAFILGRDPSAKIMIVTYGENLATEIADRVRGIMRAAWYRATFNTRISPDHARVSDFARPAAASMPRRSAASSPATVPTSSSSTTRSKSRTPKTSLESNSSTTASTTSSEIA
jgi:hypothetical protein